jgi:hypothetical protein
MRSFVRLRDRGRKWAARFISGSSGFSVRVLVESSLETRTFGPECSLTRLIIVIASEARNGRATPEIHVDLTDGL